MTFNYKTHLCCLTFQFSKCSKTFSDLTFYQRLSSVHCDRAVSSRFVDAVWTGQVPHVAELPQDSIRTLTDGHGNSCTVDFTPQKKGWVRHYSAQASYFASFRGIWNTKIEKSRGIQNKHSFWCCSVCWIPRQCLSWIPRQYCCYKEV